MKMRTRMYALLPILTVFSLFQASNIEARITNNCDCTGEDKLLKKSKCPDAKKLKEEAFYGKSCERGSKASGSSIAGLKNTLEDMTVPKGLKTPDEVLDYISCYRPSDERFCHFKNTLASRIALASQSSGLPFAVQACLIFQESKFDRNAVSDIPWPYTKEELEAAKKKNIKLKPRFKHAYGYIQFMPGTLKEQITSIIKGDDGKERIKFWESEIATKQTRLADEEAKLAKKFGVQTQKNVNILNANIQTLKAKISARKVWDEYWEGTGKVPTTATLDDVKDPSVAFALSVTKQTYDLGLMDEIKYKYTDKKSEHFLRINGMKPDESAIFLAGAYNAGIGIASDCGSVKSLDECINNFKPSAETAIHMKAIRRCASKGSTDNMVWDYDNKKFFEKKNCEGYKCK